MLDSCFTIASERQDERTTSGPDLDVEGSDAELLAAGSDVLGSQHGGVRGGLVTVGLDLHTTGNTGDGLTAAGITQKLAFEPRKYVVCSPEFPHGLFFLNQAQSPALASSFPKYRKVLGLSLSIGRFGIRLTQQGVLRKIGDVNEGVVERGEDASNAKDELTCAPFVSLPLSRSWLSQFLHRRSFLPSRV